MRSETAALLYHHVFGTAPVKAVVRSINRRVTRERLQLTERDLAIADLDPRAEGLRLLHVSDLHLRDGFPELDEIVRMARQAPADLVLYTGDFIDDDDGTPVLRSLLAEMPIAGGAFAVLGNHDHWALSRVPRRNDEAALRRALAAHGVDVLDNRAVWLEQHGVTIVGVDDPVTGFARLGPATEGLRSGDGHGSTVLLSHTPDLAREFTEWRPDLLLAGHTHGGQVCLPGIGAVFRVGGLPRRSPAGLHVLGGVPTYVSRGIGCSGVDLRVRCSPEIALLTLRLAA